MTKRIHETALAELLKDQQRAAASRFFLRIGQAGRASEDDNPTLPLFSFMDFMECDGLLAKDVAR